MPHDGIIAARGDVEVRLTDDDRDLPGVLELLDHAERTGGAPLVDEAEEARLRRRLEGAARDAGWRSLVAVRTTTPVGYGGVVLPSPSGTDATADLAVLDDRPPSAPVRQALLAGLEAVAREHATDLQVWMRHVDDEAIDHATAAGYRLERRLGVLGRTLTQPTQRSPEGPGRVRAYRPGEDDAAVVAVLSGAYAGTAEAGWSLGDLRERRALPWFRDEDLLLGELPGADGGRWVGGLHWLKRREPGVGEVYNLAIHPEAQGAGLGGVLLSAGLAHLWEIGCREVILWVDMANERAVRLYTSQGFETRWQDVAVGRSLAAAGPD